MTLQTTDNVLDRIERVKHSIANEDPRRVQVAVDGHCPNKDCNALVSIEIHSDSSSVTCTACGETFPI